MTEFIDKHVVQRIVDITTQPVTGLKKSLLICISDAGNIIVSSDTMAQKNWVV